MQDVIQNSGLESKIDAITAKVTDIRETQILNKPYMDSLIGPPTLEDRLKEHIEKRIIHKVRNIEQVIVNKEAIAGMTHSTMELKWQAENGKLLAELNQHKVWISKAESKIEILQKFMWMGLGGLAVLELALKFAVKG